MRKINKSKSKQEDEELVEEKERKMWQDAAGADVVKHLGPISKEEYDYYNNLATLR